MQLKVKVLVFVLVLVATHAQAGSDGGISTGGTDYRPVGDGSAWFLGNRTIKVCYEVAPGFGAKPDVPLVFSNAMGLWKKYYKSAHLDQIFEPEMVLDFNYEIHSSCSGGEDLALYLGVSNDEVARARLQYKNPVALVHRQSYDLKAGWGKGFIWVAPSASIINDPDVKFPDWTHPLRLQAVLTHEMGHVLGCDHMSGTIMQENFADLLGDDVDPDYQNQRLSQIDGERFLFPVFGDFNGTIGIPDEQWAPEKTFSLFTGRKSVGEIRAHLAFGGSNKVLLELTDDKGTASFQIQPNATQGPTLGTGTTMGNKLWQIAWQRPDQEPEDGGLVTFAMPSIASILYGTITTHDGTPYIVSIEINMNGLYDPPIYGPVSVWYFGMGFRRNLFSMPVAGR